MICSNCKKEFPEPTEDWCRRLCKASEELSKVLQEVGMTLRLSSSNPLGYISGGVDCCNEPNLYWTPSKETS